MVLPWVKGVCAELKRVMANTNKPKPKNYSKLLAAKKIKQDNKVQEVAIPTA